MRMLFLLAGLAYGVYLFTGGSLGTDSIFGPPETLPLSRYGDIDVSVYFYYPDEAERYLGDVRGASACGDVAYDCSGLLKLDTQLSGNLPLERSVHYEEKTHV